VRHSRLQSVPLGLAFLLAFAFSSCASTGAPHPSPTKRGAEDFVRVRPNSSPRYADGLVQGLIGLTRITSIETSLSDGSDSDEDSTLPMVGGAWQTVLHNGRLQLGFETGLTVGWDSESGTVDLGNGGGSVPSRNHLFGVDGFVGLFGGAWLTNNLRLYVGAGPLLQYAKVSVEYEDAMSLHRDAEDDGFGGGVYARAGIEYSMTPSTLVGLGVRQMSSSVDLGGGIDQVDFEATQMFLSVTQGF